MDKPMTSIVAKFEMAKLAYPLFLKDCHLFNRAVTRTGHLNANNYLFSKIQVKGKNHLMITLS